VISLLSKLGIKKGIYFLPTAMGYYLNGLIFLLILLSVGYGNNLLLIFTLFLFCFNLLWLIQTYLFHKEAHVENLTIEDSFAESEGEFKISWKNELQVKNLKLFLFCDKGMIELKVRDYLNGSHRGEIIFPMRGCWTWKKLALSSSAPFGLYQTYKFLPLSGENIVYPKRLKSVTLPNLFESNELGPRKNDRRGEDELKDFSKYAGEEFKKISWKIFAKSQELFVHQMDSSIGEEARFNWPKDYQSMDKEAGLSLLLSQLLLSFEQGVVIELSINDKQFAISHSPHTLKMCLREISLC